MKMNIHRIVNISVSVILVAAVLLTFSWFYVSGSELSFLKSLPTDCTASVTIWSLGGTNSNRNEYEADLSQDQLSQILELLQSSSFWRDPASAIIHHEQKTYTILINYESDGTAQYLSITSSGGYAVNISGSQEIPFENNFLRIRNKNWVSKLDAILAP